MRITDVRVRKMTQDSKMKAIVSITIDDEFVVHDIKVIEGEKGLFIAMPSKKATDGEYRDIAHPINSVTREHIQNIILDSYEKIHPYGDERVYVKLEPKDFIILQSKYQHLVNNSFLLHGFYNYRYLILGKEQDYYLGVPGVFYEREKMVALMFGFEAFECSGGVARAGEFGYYLRKVEL